MKKFICILLITTGLTATAQNRKDIEVKTSVSEATVFIKGAQVVRKTTVNLPAGVSIVRFSKLSPYIDAKSVQVKIDGEIMVLSINHQQNHNDSLKQSIETEQWRKHLDDLNEKITIEQINKSIVSEELAFLKDNKKIGGNEKGIDFTNLKSTAAYYGERITALKTRDFELDKKIKILMDEKNDVQRKLNATSGIKPEPTGEVLMTVDCKTAVQAPVEISYYVNNAGWFPSYDLRARTISEPVELICKANIMQNTREEWKNIRLKVSSANPNQGGVATKLKTYQLNYHTKPPRYGEAGGASGKARGQVFDTDGMPLPGVSVSVKGTNIGTYTDIDGRFELSLPTDGSSILNVSYVGYDPNELAASSNMHIVMQESETTLDEVVVVGYGTQRKADIALPVSDKKESKPKNIPIPVLQVENQVSMEFEIQTPYTIPSENKNTTVAMKQHYIPAEYEYYCAPKADRDAFLFARIVDWEQYNLIEGEANIFFENTFVGKTVLDVRYVSDTLSLSLGRDKNVSVQREKVKEYSTKKILGSKAETSREWKITVRNNKRQPITMSLFDQIPVSTMQEIEVTAENISNGTLHKDTGEVKWKFTLSPSQKSELNLKYKVKYPKEKMLTVE
ncbi:MAG: mucoidy inhibitor MuiA family protein [Bacteroidales bacterium]|jgi:hypothetical protein|nr:mucoidy inhibitor MuiA family protein [Bacteroidales bacterium]